MKEKRQKEILDYILAEHFTEVKKIADKFKVSEMTVRRDLAKLEKSGLIRLVFGGRVEKTSDQKEPIYKLRMYENIKEKEKIALIADKLIKDMELIFLDVGSTCLYLAKIIFNRDITIVTSWIPNMIELSKGDKCKIINTGGEIDKRELNSINSICYEVISNFNFDKVLIGVGGITEEGITDYRMSTIDIKNKVMQNAKEVIILADHSKFGKIAPIKISSFQKLNVSTVITSDITKIDVNILNEIKKYGIKILSELSDVDKV